jgi:hypothetical protein
MSTEKDLRRTNPAEAATQLGQLIQGYRATSLIGVAAQLGIADLLGEGPKSSQELADVVGVRQRDLYRLLRALASLGIFAETESGRFVLTPLAELLQTQVPGSMRSTAILHSTLLYRAWGNLLLSTRTGTPSFDQVYGTGFWEYLDSDPEARETFNQAMTTRSDRDQSEVLHSYDFSGISKIVDVGGGQGSLISAILGANPDLRGILFDLPAVVRGARELIEAKGLIGRCDIVGGDFFKSVPGGGDAYILQAVIHD